MLLVLLPVCGLVVFASIAAVGDWRQADRLREFRSATRLSFASAQAFQAVSGERMAATLSRLRHGPRAGTRTRSAFDRMLK
jgi:hypothetical protein